MDHDDRYLRGPFAPVKEEVTAYDLPVTGRLPADLNGRYLRLGPNPLGVEDPVTHFWAFGAGMVHGVRIRDGRAEWYRNRWVRSAEVSDALDRMARGLEPPAFLPPSPNIHVLRHAGRTLALSEAGGLPHELGYELDTIGECPMGATPEGSSANAHSKVDPRTGDLHSVAYVLGRPYAQHVVTGPAGTVTRVTDLPLPGDLPFLHDFGLSENFVVVFDIPLTFDMEAMRFRWNPEHQAHVGVLPRAGGQVRWFPAESFYVSHVLNAYDDGSTITVDLIAAEGPVDVADPGGIRPRLDRWRIDLRAGRLEQRCVDDRAQDFPRVNDAYASRPHRYGYSAVTPVYGMRFVPEGPHPDDAFTNALVKHDLVRGTTEVHGFARDAAVGEAAFAADPSAGGHEAAEDAGYLMAYVADPGRGASDLVILSAQDFTGPPVARVHLPVRVPLGFHGNWIPDA
ncbi:carotenoid oxygenase family protein [Nonomuraea candida]|uniref:carotenoid oxygenase family protein n=1 Tax=Nonomuraea candida TaxID=359159 RepID=UPI0005BD9B27|nr:carotenoid oxygenase family protein [Nonomuraea candida]